jgi:hypothetical protein
MLRQLLAIVIQTVRAAVRSRLLLSLLTVLLFACIALPLSVRGDGTVISELRIALSYSMTIALVILGVVTLWASAGAVSQEVEGKQIRLAAVKPLSPYILWIGKWLGIVLLNAFCLLVVALLLGAHIQRIMQRVHAAEDTETIRSEVLTARLLVPPDRTTIDVHALHRRAEFLKSRGLITEDDEHEALRIVEKQIQAEQAVVKPGDSRTWVFDLTRNRAIEPPAILQYRLAPTVLNTRQLSGSWLIHSKNQSPAARLPKVKAHEGRGLLTIPSEMLTEGQPIEITYTNPREQGSKTVIFHRTTPLVLLIGEGAFCWNLLRAMLVMLCILATLSAIGVTLGSLFSFPVASFAAFSVLLIILTSQFMAFSAATPNVHTHAHADGECEISVQDDAAAKTLQHVHKIIAPTGQIHAVHKLSHGIRIRWAETAQCILLLGLLYPGLLGLAGGWYLNRRELAR